MSKFFFFSKKKNFFCENEKLDYTRFLEDFYYHGTLNLPCIRGLTSIRNWVTFCGLNGRIKKIWLNFIAKYLPNRGNQQLWYESPPPIFGQFLGLIYPAKINLFEPRFKSYTPLQTVWSVLCKRALAEVGVPLP